MHQCIVPSFEMILFVCPRFILFDCSIFPIVPPVRLISGKKSSSLFSLLLFIFFKKQKWLLLRTCAQSGNLTSIIWQLEHLPNGLAMPQWHFEAHLNVALSPPWAVFIYFGPDRLLHHEDWLVICGLPAVCVMKMDFWRLWESGVGKLPICNIKSTLVQAFLPAFDSGCEAACIRMRASSWDLEDCVFWSGRTLNTGLNHQTAGWNGMMSLQFLNFISQNLLSLFKERMQLAVLRIQLCIVWAFVQILILLFLCKFHHYTEGKRSYSVL